MRVSDMEDAIKNLDHRLARVEQILPTLATKLDLAAVKTELKQDIADGRRRAEILSEDVRDDIAKVAEGVASLATNAQSHTRLLESVVRRLDQHDVVLQAIVRRDV